MRKLLLPILVFALVLSSCTDDLTNLNEDPKGASDVPAEPLFTNALVSLGTLNNSVDYNINMFTHMAQYWSQTTYNDESSYDITTRAIPSAYWSEIYRNVLNDLKESSRLIEENELIPAGQKTIMQAQIEVVNVMAYYQLVTTFGNIPYEEALDANNPSPVFDNQAEVYGKLMSRLNTAISDLGSGSDGFNASSDVFYSGDVVAWERFANSLKMRMAMTVADVGGDVSFDPQEEFEAASPNAFTSNEHSLALQYDSSVPNANPVWERVINSGRDDFVAADRLIDEMNTLNDPRLPIHFSTVSGAYVGGPYGAQNDYSNFSHIVGPLIEPGFEGMQLEYAEVEFLRAEAAVRGWSVSGTAETHYNNAIRADMEYWSNASTSEEITSEPGPANDDVDAYLAQADVAFPTGQADQLKAIAEQKWLGLYMQGRQAWVEWRRLDHPTFYYSDVDNPDVTSEDDIPVRFVYPVDEQNLNEANWDQAAIDIGGDETSTQLFWDTDPVSSVN